MTVRIYESNRARANWRDVLDDAAAGSTDVIVERYGKPVVAVIAYDDYLALQDELDDLRAARRAAAIYEEWKRDPSSARPYAELRAELVAEGESCMNTETDLQQKAVDAFKGFIRNYRLKPTSQKTKLSDQEYEHWYGFVQIGEELFDLFPRRRDSDRLLALVDRLFPEQTHAKTVYKLLENATLEWIKQGYSGDDQLDLEQVAREFLDEVERLIRDLVAYIPIEGIELSMSRAVQLARCQLLPNGSDSELMQVALRDSQREGKSRKILPAIEEAPAFFKVKMRCHFKKAIEQGKEEAELALNVLRFFLAHSYFDVHRGAVSREMGILGTLHEGVYGRMYIVSDNAALDEQFPGFSESYKHTRSFTISSADVDYIEAHGLTRINEHLQSLARGDGIEIAGSLLRAISWFGKATNARSKAESFLLYAISIEALLLGGERPRKETYGQRIAALVTRQGDAGIFPFGGYISARFDDDLAAASDRSDRFKVVYERVVDLFDKRNKVAHGTMLGSDIDTADLQDFETLVRNSILSFVDGGWNGLGEYKEWMNRGIAYRFSPPPAQ
jgi:prevent-host-death family protein